MKKIKVTKNCIAKGQKLSLTSCPVAIALRRAGFVRPVVSTYYFTHGIEGDFEKQLPVKVRKFIKLFDLRHRHDPKPITFWI